MDTKTLAAIDAYVEVQRRRLNIPGVSLAIVEGDRIVHLHGFGRAQPGGDVPCPDTPFFIGSLTKSFTALAVMQLVEAGKIELDASVQRYLPWFQVADPTAAAQMTVRHLLNQTSGLAMSVGLATLGDFDSHEDATERQVRALSTLKLTRPVGAKFEYSNTNYNILGLIVEAASSESYSDYVQQHIFQPLDMTHSYTSKRVAQQNGLAVGHRYWFGHPVPAPDLFIPPGSLPSGQLISSAEDMAHYLIANLNGGRYGGRQILSGAGIAELHRGVAEWREMGWLVGHYGMGWISQGTGSSRIVSHSGTMPDFGAVMAIVPAQHTGLVLLCNANNAMMKMALDEFGLGAAQLLAGGRPATTWWSAGMWLMRGLLLVPLFQIASFAGTVLQLRRWRQDSAPRPSRRRMWGRYVGLPLIPNLLIVLSLLPLLGKMRGFMLLYMPDFSWIARICGSFALLWSLVRTGLVLGALRERTKP
jgi:CubicO group peptidase (beta-lactamase class C family)